MEHVASVADRDGYPEALARRDQLRQQLRDLQAELKRVEDYVSLHEQLFGTSAKEGSQSQPAPRMRQRNIFAPERLTELAREIILSRGRPMTRSQIAEAIIERGFPLGGRDPVKNLGTILWRFRDAFANIPRYGYWPRDVPNAALPKGWDQAPN